MLLALFLWHSSLSFAQDTLYQTTTSTPQGSMSKWEKFTGNWKGSIWSMDSKGKKLGIEHAYNIQLMLDGSLLFLESTTTQNGEVHNKSIVITTFDE